MLNTIKILVPISVGELLDKISILEIKKEKITTKDKLKNILNELNYLNDIWSGISKTKEIEENFTNLKKTNLILWDIEEKKRGIEKTKIFNEEFIQLARMVYIYNDKRAEIKKQINILTNSFIVEEKSYN